MLNVVYMCCNIYFSAFSILVFLYFFDRVVRPWLKVLTVFVSDGKQNEKKRGERISAHLMCQRHNSYLKNFKNFINNYWLSSISIFFPCLRRFDLFRLGKSNDKRKFSCHSKFMFCVSRCLIFVLYLFLYFSFAFVFRVFWQSPTMRFFFLDNNDEKLLAKRLKYLRSMRKTRGKERTKANPMRTWIGKAIETNDNFNWIHDLAIMQKRRRRKTDKEI